MRFNTGGLVLIGLGVLLLLNNLGIFNLDWNDLSKYWPVVLVIAGLSMLLPRGPKKDDSVQR